MHHTVQSMKHDHYGCITAIHVPSNDVILLFVGSLGTNDCSREDFSKLVCQGNTKKNLTNLGFEPLPIHTA